MSRKRDSRNYEFKSFESTKKKDEHIRITKSMMTSNAWKSLSCPAKVLYMELKSKYRGSNDNDISLTHSECSLNQRQYMKAICDLVTMGFIEIEREGYFTRQCNIYKLSSLWRVYPNNDYSLPERYKPKKNVVDFSTFKNV